MLETKFKEWLHSVETTILVCWDLGHVWDAELYSHIEKVHGAYFLHGVCKRGCGVERGRYLTSSWSPDPSRNTYKYPFSYSPRGLMQGSPFFMDREHRAAIRQEIARRYAEDAGSKPGKVVRFKGA